MGVRSDLVCSEVARNDSQKLVGDILVLVIDLSESMFTM